MNQYPGVFGCKLGMTQLVSEDGTVSACTVIEARNVVVAKRTVERDGYSALVLGQGEVKDKHLTKAQIGSFKANGVKPQRQLREFRCPPEHAAKFEVGQELPLADLFEEGQYLDVASVSRGRGFSGVIRRHNFAGAVTTHGTHEYRRHGGSIGTNMTPGRTMKGRKMPGQCGNVRVSVLNQKVVKILADKQLLLVHGGVPGPTGALVEVRGAVKRAGGRKAS
jgi:large subunit ribosomal protein L3